MKILFISDIFSDQWDYCTNEIDICKWKDAEAISFGEYTAVVLDFSFGELVIPSNFGNILLEFKTRFEKPFYISKNNILLIVICGEQNKDFQCLPEENEFENFHQDDYDGIEMIGMYDILENLLIDFQGSVGYETGKHRFSLVSIPIHYYIDQYKYSKIYLSYEYDHITDANKLNRINPLARQKKINSPLVAFECKHGQGTVMVLPSYDLDDAKNAQKYLLMIINSYHKKKSTGMELNEIDGQITGIVRESLIEAVSCFHNDLYSATLLMCRRAIEKCINEIYESTAINEDKKLKFLEKKIKHLKHEGLISSEMNERLYYIRRFGNWAAHPDISDEKITEEDARVVIDFTKLFLNQYIVLAHKSRKMRDRQKKIK